MPLVKTAHLGIPPKKKGLQMKRERIIFELIQDLLMGLVITSTVTAINGTGFFPIPFLQDFLLAYGINLLIGFGLPEMKLAQGIIRPLNILLPWLQKILVVTIISIINVTLILAAVLLIKVGANPAWLGAFGHLYPPLIAAGILAGNVAFPISAKLSGME